MTSKTDEALVERLKRHVDQLTRLGGRECTDIVLDISHAADRIEALAKVEGELEATRRSLDICTTIRHSQERDISERIAQLASLRAQLDAMGRRMEAAEKAFNLIRSELSDDDAFTDLDTIAEIIAAFQKDTTHDQG
jgi:DNA repair exonuclease SbcCD ATPase subunit